MAINVLIADDHGIMRAGLRALLSAEQDVQVVGEAEDGEMAVRLTGELLPDVVLLDISMPGLNGIQATKTIRTLFPQVHVLILTLHEDDSLLRQALANGASGFVVKRAAGSELLNALRTAQRGEFYVHSFMTHALLDKVEQPEFGQAAPGGNLTQREIEVLKLIAEGYTSRRIAASLHISVRTVEGHRARITNKLGLSSPIQIIRYAMKHGLLNSESN